MAALPNLLVSGCSVHGIYEFAGQRNGRLHWRSMRFGAGSEEWLHWASGRWEILSCCGQVMFFVDSQDEFPPCDGWRVCDSQNSEAPYLSIASDIWSQPLLSRAAISSESMSKGAACTIRSSAATLVFSDPTEAATLTIARDCQVTVMTLAGNVMTVANLDLSDTGAALKAQVATASGLHETHQRLMLEGKEISNVATIRELGCEVGVDATVLFVSGLSMCADCGRKFTHDRIDAHARSCTRTSKRQTKTFNSMRKRLADLANAKRLISTAEIVEETSDVQSRLDEVPSWRKKSHELRGAMAAKRRQAESLPRQRLQAARSRAACANMSNMMGNTVSSWSAPVVEALKLGWTSAAQKYYDHLRKSPPWGRHLIMPSVSSALEE